MKSQPNLKKYIRSLKASSLALVTGLVIIATGSANAATETYVGPTAANNNWSLNTNWSTTTPANGDSLVFSNNGATPISNSVDNINGLQIKDITFNANTNNITLNNNLQLGAALNVSIHNSVVVDPLNVAAGAQTISGSTIKLGGADITRWQTDTGAQTGISSKVNLNGSSLSFTGGGTTTLTGQITGMGNGTHSGSVVIGYGATGESGNLVLNNTSGVDSNFTAIPAGKTVDAIQILAGSLTVTHSGKTDVGNGPIGFGYNANLDGQDGAKGAMTLASANGAGAVVLDNKINIYTTDPIALNGGTTTGDSLELSGKMTLVTYTSDPGSYIGSPSNVSATPNTVTLTNTGGAVILSGRIAEAGTSVGVTLNGGNFTFAGTSSNTYTGLTTVSANTELDLNKTGVNAITGDLQVDIGGTAKLLQGDQIKNSSAVTLNGTFDLNGNSDSIGSLSGTSTSAVLTNTSTAGTASSLTIGNATSTTYAGIIEDGSVVGSTVAITKDGNGTLTLTGTSTYSGDTTVTNGTLAAGSTTAFSAKSAYTVNDSTLDVGGFDNEIGSLAGNANGVVTNSGVDAAILTTGGLNTSTTFDGTIVDGTSTIGLTKIGTGTQTLTGANTYTGATLVSAGTLAAGAANTFSDASATEVDATLDLGGFDNAISTVTGTGTITNSGATDATLTVGDLNTSSTFVGVIIDGGTNKTLLTKTGTGTFTLTGANTYSGATLVSGGTLAAGAQNTFSKNSAVTVNGVGSTLDIRGFDNEIGSLAGDVDGVVTNSGTADAILKTGGLNTNTTFAGTIVDGATNIIGLTKIGTGTQTLTGANTYSGATLVSGGTLAAGATNTFSDNSAVTVNGATLDLGGYNNAIGSLAGDADGVVTNAGATDATLTVGDLNTSTDFAGSITDGLTNTTALTKQGTGTQTLSGSTLNTYSGDTNVTAGTLMGGALNAFSKNSNVTLTNADSTLDLGEFDQEIGSLSGDAGTFVRSTGITGNTAILTTTNVLGNDTEFDGVIQDDGPVGLTKLGVGTLTLGGANTYSGDTTIKSGTISSSAANTFSANSDVYMVNTDGTSTLDLNGFDNHILALTGAAGTTITNSAAATQAILTIHDHWYHSTTFAGDIVDGAGALGIKKIGHGTLTLTGNNTYSLGTNIDAGTIAVGSATALGTGDVRNNGRLETTASTITAPVRAINIGGIYTQTANGELRLQIENPASYDTTLVTGAANLDGTLHFNFEAGSTAVQGDRYVALSAGSTLLTQFATPTELTTDGPSLTNFYAITTYNDTFGGTVAANSAVVTLYKPFSTFGGLTTNQIAVAKSVDQYMLTAWGNNINIGNTDFFDNIVTGLNIASVGNNLGSSLNELSPQRFEMLRNVAFDNYAFDVQGLDNHLANARDGQFGLDTTGFAYNDRTIGSTLSQVKGHMLAWMPTSEPGLMSDVSQATMSGVEMTSSKDLKEMAPASLPIQKWNMFIDGGVDLGDLQSTVDTQHASYTTGGVRAGADYRVAPDVRVGALFGYNQTDATLDNEGSSATVNSYTPGIYASYANKSGFYANALATYTYNDYSTDRKIQIPGVSRTANGSTAGNQFGGNITTGYEMRKGGFVFGPSLGLSYVNLGIDSFTETGAGSASLNVGNQSAESLRSRVGGTVRYQGKVGSVILTPHFGAFWQHEFLNDQQLISSSFAGIPTAGTFAVQTTRGDSDNALLNTGLDAQITKNLTLFVDYSTEVGGASYFGQSATGGVKLGF